MEPQSSARSLDGMNRSRLLTGHATSQAREPALSTACGRQALSTVIPGMHSRERTGLCFFFSLSLSTPGPSCKSFPAMEFRVRASRCRLAWLFLVCSCLGFSVKEGTSISRPEPLEKSRLQIARLRAAEERSHLAPAQRAVDLRDSGWRPHGSWLERSSGNAEDLSSSRSGPVPAASRARGLPQERAGFFRHARRALGRSVRSWYDAVQHRLRRWRISLTRVPEFKEAEPGDQIVLAMLTMFSREIAAVRRPGPDTSNEEFAIGNTFWVAGVTRLLLSEISGQDVALVRGPVLGKGENSIVVSARNIRTLEDMALKIFVLPGSTVPAEDLETVRRAGLLFGRFFRFGSPQQVHDRLRFMVASDMLTLPNEPRFRVVELIRRSYTVLNRFLVMPTAATDVFTLLKALFADRAMSSSEVVMMARLQITSQVVRLAALLQSRKFVHGGLKPPAFLVMPDGRVFLSDFTRLCRTGFRGRIDPADPYNPPEFDGVAEAVYSAAVDAWQVGLTVFQVWCLKLPFNLFTPGLNLPARTAPRQVPRVATDVSLDFTECVQMPAYVQDLVTKFLLFSEKARLLPVEALREGAFGQLEKEIELRLK